MIIILLGIFIININDATMSINYMSIEYLIPFYNESITYFNNGNFDQALHSITQAYIIANNYDKVEWKTCCYIIMGQIYNRKYKLEKAKKSSTK